MHPSLISQFNLAGKSAIVTGASRGLGISFARGLAKAGCNLVITARDFERLQRVAQDLEQYGGAVIPFKADATQVKDAEAVVDRALEAFGRLDILVNNAGISAVAEAETMSSVQWQSVIDTNLTGLFYGAQSASRPMLRAGLGQDHQHRLHVWHQRFQLYFPGFLCGQQSRSAGTYPRVSSRMGAARTECRGFGSGILPLRPDRLGF